MKLIDKIAIASASVCALISAIDTDFTEMMAWIIVIMWNIKEFIPNKKD